MFVIIFVFALVSHPEPMQMWTSNTWPSLETCEQGLETEGKRFASFLAAQRQTPTSLTAKCIEDPRAQGYPPGNIDKGGV